MRQAPAETRPDQARPDHRVARGAGRTDVSRLDYFHLFRAINPNGELREAIRMSIRDGSNTSNNNNKNTTQSSGNNNFQALATIASVGGEVVGRPGV